MGNIQKPDNSKFRSFENSTLAAESAERGRREPWNGVSVPHVGSKQIDHSTASDSWRQWTHYW